PHSIPTRRSSDLNPQHLFARHGETNVVEHRRNVVAAINVRKHLIPSAALAHLFEATVQVPHLNIDPADRLTAQFHHAANGSMHRWMCRTNVHEHGFGRKLNLTLFEFYVQWFHRFRLFLDTFGGVDERASSHSESWFET